MNSVTDLSLYLCVCCIPLLGTYLAPLLMQHYRVSKRAFHLIFIGVVVFHILLCFVVYLDVGCGRDARVFMGTGPVLAYYGLFFCVCRYRDGRFFFTCLSILLLCAVCCALCSLLAPFGSLLWVEVWCLFFAGMAFLLHRYIRKPLNEMFHGVAKGWLMRSLMPLFLLLLLFVVFYNPLIHDGYQVAERAGTLLLCAMSILNYFHLYQLFKTMQRQYDLQRDAGLLLTQSRAMERHAEETAAAAEKNAIFRHDQRHLLALLRSSLSGGDTEGATQILDTMQEGLDKLSTEAPKAYTGHKLLDAVLSLAAWQAERQGTEFTVRMVLPEKWAVDMTELCVMLSNALENALTACDAMPEGEPRQIRLLAGVTGNQFFLSLSNTYFGIVRMDADTGAPISERSGHGYGSRSIAAFVKKYDGILEYKAEGGWFILTLLLG